MSGLFPTDALCESFQFEGSTGAADRRLNLLTALQLFRLTLGHPAQRHHRA